MKIHNKFDENHIKPQTMGNSFYHMLQHHFHNIQFTKLFISLLDANAPNFISTALRYNPLWHHRSGIYEKYIPWVISTAYVGKHELKTFIQYEIIIW